jgi:hypothetical protein
MPRSASHLLIGFAVLACSGEILEGDRLPAEGPGQPSGDAPRPSGTPTPMNPPPGVLATQPTPMTAPAPPSCSSPQPGRAPLRRLTRAEYTRTVRDLFGSSLSVRDPAAAFPPEETSHGFKNDADRLTVSPDLVSAYMAAAEAIAADVTATPQKAAALLGCDPASGGDPCTRAFVERFGRRIWRRPLTAAEIDDLARFHAAHRVPHGFVTASRLVLERMLQSPEFLYRIESGRPASAGEEVVRLTPFETASRLSYLVWGSMPDEALFRAAEGGELETREGIVAQARRMLADPRAKTALKDLFDQWLRLDMVDAIDQDPTAFPKFHPELVPLYRKETETFVDAVLWSGDGSLTTLLSAPYTFMNAKLATFYGAQGPAGAAFERVELDPTKRLGLLTHAGLLAAHAGGGGVSTPILRGVFLRENLLCDELPPPPDVDTTLAERPGLTVRQRLDEIQGHAQCGACHRLINPLGLGFEHFDGIGLHRTHEGAAPIDASGELLERTPAGEELAHRFDGAVDLVTKLSRSEMVRSCVVRRWFRFGYGRQDDRAGTDACGLAYLETEFAKADYDLRALTLALTQTDTFLFRPAGQGDAP